MADSEWWNVGRIRGWYSGLPIWISGSMAAAGLFAGSRLVMWAAAYVVTVIDPTKDTFDLTMGWDAGWYLAVAENGYEKVVPDGVGPIAQTNLVFFPMYPLTFRVFSGIFDVSVRQAALIVSLLSGLTGSILLWHLAREFTDREGASRAVALMVFFPAAYVLSMGYAEGMFIMLVAASLLALVRERWLIAGVAAMFAGATRLPGIALCFVCAWAAFQAIRTRRDWSSLVAPALAPLGTLAFMGYQWAHVGSPLAWLDSQRRGWGNEASAGQFFDAVGQIFSQDRYEHFTIWQGGIGLAFLVLGIWLLVAWKPPASLTIYTAGVLAPTVLAGLFTPRYSMVALPLFIAIGRVVKGPAYYALLGMSATMMALLWVVISLTRASVP